MVRRTSSHVESRSGIEQFVPSEFSAGRDDYNPVDGRPLSVESSRTTRNGGQRTFMGGASPHYSREMRDQSQAVDIVHSYANGLFGEVFLQ